MSYPPRRGEGGIQAPLEPPEKGELRMMGTPEEFLPADNPECKTTVNGQIMVPLIFNIHRLQNAVFGFRAAIVRQQLSDRDLTLTEWVAALSPNPQEPAPVQWKPLKQGATK